MTRLRLFVVFFVVSQRQKKGAEEGEALRVPIRAMCWLGMEGYPKSLFRSLVRVSSMLRAELWLYPFLI